MGSLGGFRYSSEEEPLSKRHLPRMDTVLQPAASGDEEQFASILISLKDEVRDARHGESANGDSNAQSIDTKDEPQRMEVAGDAPFRPRLVHSRTSPPSLNGSASDSSTDDDDWGDPVEPPAGLPKKLIRKKAPSGAACEKHKRWKKRCPDDCPYRHPRFRNVKANDSDDFGDYKKTVRFESTQGDVFDPMIPRGRRRRGQYVATVACEKHTLLHARCPPNCTDRRAPKRWDPLSPGDPMDEGSPYDGTMDAHMPALTSFNEQQLHVQQHPVHAADSPMGEATRASPVESAMMPSPTRALPGRETFAVVSPQ